MIQSQLLLQIRRVYGYLYSPPSPHLFLQILHLFELFGPEAKVLSSEERATLVGEIRRLKKYASQLGISKMKGLRREMKLWRCMVDSEDAVMIVPDGRLGFCEHHLEDRFFGDIDHEEWDMDVVRQSREYCEEIAECDTCALYPVCYRLKICGISDRCFKESRESELLSIQEQMLKKYRELNGVLY